MVINVQSIMHTPLDPYADAAVRFRKQLGMIKGDQHLGRDVSTSTILCGNCNKGKTTEKFGGKKVKLL